MKVDIPKGKYVVAVSGGVDSMVLLDLLAQNPDLELIVAHFNHGIRKDSAEDENLVRQTAERRGLTFETGYGKLGKETSEDQARTARYEFLEKTRQKYSADAVITAHHRDDELETALINLLRGTGWRGLVSVKNEEKLLRPLLTTSKTEILEYAQENKLEWREDSTNQEDKYLRNYLRRHIIPKMSQEQKREVLERIEQAKAQKFEKDRLIATISQSLLKQNTLKRPEYTKLPRKVAEEVLLNWLRDQNVTYDRQLIYRVDLAIRNSRAGTTHNLSGKYQLRINDREASLVHRS